MHNPSVEVLVKIADFFQVSTDYLLNGTPEQSTTPPLSPESRELVHIYESLHGRDRLKLLHYAVELEQNIYESSEET